MKKRPQNAADLNLCGWLGDAGNDFHYLAGTMLAIKNARAGPGWDESFAPTC
jgi:hypothetical protein